MIGLVLVLENFYIRVVQCLLRVFHQAYSALQQCSFENVFHTLQSENQSI